MVYKSIDELLIEKFTGEWGNEPNNGCCVNVIRTTNFTDNGFPDLSEVAKRDIPKEIVQRKKLQNGDIILEKSGGSDNRPVGRVIIFNNERENEEFLCNNFTQVLRFNPEVVFPLYVLYCLLNLHCIGVTERFQNKTTGIRNLQTSIYLQQKILVPNLTTQKEIAAILAKVQSAIRKRNESISTADEYLKSVFFDMFGDCIADNKYHFKTLHEIAEVTSGVTKGRKLGDNRKTVVMPYLSVSNVKDGYLDLNFVKEIEVYEDEIEKYSLKSDDLLLTEGGDPDKLGRGTLWHEEISPCLHQNHIFRVRINKNIANPVYVSRLIGSSYGKAYFFKAAKQTTGIASINSKQLKNFKVILPPLEQQNEFAEIVKKIEALKEQQKKSLEQLETTFKSLMQRAFKGELI